MEENLSLADYLVSKLPPPPVKMRVADFRKFVSNLESDPSKLGKLIVSLMEFQTMNSKAPDDFFNIFKEIDPTICKAEDQ